MSGPHPTHKTRVSIDASSYDEICTLCGATDELGGWGALAKPCPKTTKPKKCVMVRAARGLDGPEIELACGARLRLTEERYANRAVYYDCPNCWEPLK